MIANAGDWHTSILLISCIVAVLPKASRCTQCHPNGRGLMLCAANVWRKLRRTCGWAFSQSYAISIMIAGAVHGQSR